MILKKVILVAQNAFKFLCEQLLTKVYDYAYYGNMKAAKIFMDATAGMNEGTGKIQNQQNYFIPFLMHRVRRWT